MILEHALLRVRPAQEAMFEAAMREARALIAASPGFLSLAVHPAVERPGTYLLLVGWSDVAAHRDGFRKSERYEAWRMLLHRFYDPMPEVAYFGESLF
jgi:heme-degrading monooxygenase HmoA